MAKSQYVQIMDRLVAGELITIEFDGDINIQRCRVGLQKLRPKYAMLIDEGEQITFTVVSKDEFGRKQVTIALRQAPPKPKGFTILS